jgi:biotin carboxyl carrier protein
MDDPELLRPLLIGGGTYQTRFTRKFLARRTYTKPDPRKITCVIPGVIRKICVEEGAKVLEGERLLVLEAMKMRNDILAHGEARILRVCVSEGDLVTKGQLLMELE